jgi:hypothetical protein
LIIFNEYKSRTIDELREISYNGQGLVGIGSLDSFHEDVETRCKLRRELCLTSDECFIKIDTDEPGGKDSFIKSALFPYDYAISQIKQIMPTIQREFDFKLDTPTKVDLGVKLVNRFFNYVSELIDFIQQDTTNIIKAIYLAAKDMNNNDLRTEDEHMYYTATGCYSWS